jgi:hypothetical protein
MRTGDKNWKSYDLDYFFINIEIWVKWLLYHKFHFISSAILSKELFLIHNSPSGIQIKKKMRMNCFKLISSQGHILGILYLVWRAFFLINLEYNNITFTCIYAKRREERLVVEFGQTVGVFMRRYSQKQYFKVAHTIDLGLNDENANDVWMLGHYCENN